MTFRDKQAQRENGAKEAARRNADAMGETARRDVKKGSNAC